MRDELVFEGDPVPRFGELEERADTEEETQAVAIADRLPEGVGDVEREEEAERDGEAVAEEVEEADTQGDALPLKELECVPLRLAKAEPLLAPDTVAAPLELAVAAPGVRLPREEPVPLRVTEAQPEGDTEARPERLPPPLGSPAALTVSKGVPVPVVEPQGEALALRVATPLREGDFDTLGLPLAVGVAHGEAVARPVEVGAGLSVTRASVALGDPVTLHVTVGTIEGVGDPLLEWRSEKLGAPLALPQGVALSVFPSPRLALGVCVTETVGSGEGVRVTGGEALPVARAVLLSVAAREGVLSSELLPEGEEDPDSEGLPLEERLADALREAAPLTVKNSDPLPLGVAHVVTLQLREAAALLLALRLRGALWDALVDAMLLREGLDETAELKVAGGESVVQTEAVGAAELLPLPLALPEGLPPTWLGEGALLVEPHELGVEVGEALGADVAETLPQAQALLVGAADIELELERSGLALPEAQGEALSVGEDD